MSHYFINCKKTKMKRNEYVITATMLRLPGHLAVLCSVIFTHRSNTGDTNLSNEFLADLLGISVGALKKRIKELTQRGLLTIKTDEYTGNRLLTLLPVVCKLEIPDDVISDIELNKLDL